MCHSELTEYFVAFCDNSAATSALRKGYGPDKAANALVSLYTAVAAMTQKWPYLEHVASDANISDGVSRQDFSIPLKLGWEPRVLPARVWEILIETVELPPNALERAARALIATARDPDYSPKKR